MIKKFYSLFQVNSYDRNLEISIINRFEIGLFGFRIFTFFWLIHKLFNYLALYERPKELYFQVSYFGQLFAPILPPQWLFILIWIVALSMNILQLKKLKMPFQIILFLTLIWINVIEWSLGYLSHVGHLFILLHLLIVFVQNKSNNSNYSEFILAIKWINIGVFSTYTLAGLWKVLTLLKMLILNSWENSWMQPKAMLYQLITHNRDWDLDMSYIYWLFEIPYLWQFAYIILVAVQFFSILAGIYYKYIPIFVTLIVGMHVFNVVFFQVEFYTPIFVLIVFYFPYFLSKKYVDKITNLLQ